MSGAANGSGLSGKKWLILFSLLLVTASLRFNRNDLVISVPPADDLHYARMVELFRGNEVIGALYAFYTRRPLVPLLAAPLPFAPATSVNVVNLLFLCLGLYFLLRTLRDLGFTPRQQFRGGLIYVLSFPLFYYSTIGYVDPGIMGLLGLGVWLAWREKWLPLLLLIPIATLAKESAILLVIFSAAVLLSRQQLRQRFWIPALGFILWLGIFVLLRMWSPGEDVELIWQPGMDMLQFNLARWRAWASGLLTLGIPGLLLIRWTWMHRRDLWNADGLAFWICSLAAIGIWFYAWTAAYVDGRTLWAMYVFAIPLLGEPRTEN